MENQTEKKIKIQPRSLLLIFIFLAVIILVYSLIAVDQSKNELRLLMEEQAHSLLETTLASSKTALLSYEIVDKEMKTRLLNNAALVKLLLRRNQISNSRLEQIANDNKIFRINIFNNKGKKVFTSHQSIHSGIEEKFSPKDFLQPIFSGQADTLFLGVKEARFEEGYRFAVAISTDNEGAIVLNLDAEELLTFRKNIGMGALLKKVSENEGIIYAALQDSMGIIAASGDLVNLQSINQDPFLKKSLLSLTFQTRINVFDSTSIFEAVHPFVYNGQTIGLLRLGLNAQPLIDITESGRNRVLIMGVILFVLGSILMVYVFTKQNFDVLKKDYQIIEEYSEKVIQNVSDSVIVLDIEQKVKTFNKAAENLFGKNGNEVIGRDLSSLFNLTSIEEIFAKNSFLEPMKIEINNENKYLLISKSEFQNNQNQNNTIYVIRDLTKQRIAEEQIIRKERLVAMGELASGVAHEIRNPLNTISTITQQLKKDFEPVENSNEYNMLTSLVNKEINRINETVKDFLRFSKPEKISLSEFRLSDLLNQLENQYSNMLGEKSIKMIIKLEWDGMVNWDRNQIQQVMMNLIQNAYDSIKSSGEINLSVKNEQEEIIITVADTGTGIPKHQLNNIFNLYFTTKAKGTGIGLSIVQKIIFEHNGIVEVESVETKGTIFTIKIPINSKINL